MKNSVDAVIDLAGLSNDAAADIDPLLTEAINLDGAKGMANLAKNFGVKKYIYSSSCSVYGEGARLGLKEADDCNPLTAYAESKVGAERHLRSLASPDFDPIILRNATVFGVAPRMRFDLAVNIMTLRAWRDNLLYLMGERRTADQAVHSCAGRRESLPVMALEYKGYSNQTFNVGDDSMNSALRSTSWRRASRAVFPDRGNPSGYSG